MVFTYFHSSLESQDPPLNKYFFPSPFFTLSMQDRYSSVLFVLLDNITNLAQPQSTTTMLEFTRTEDDHVRNSNNHRLMSTTQSQTA